MKVAVLKLGARIVFGNKIGTSGGSGEAASIINMMVKGGLDVHCYTKILKNDLIPTDVELFNIEEAYDSINDHGYDALVVINGTVNFFGGAEDRPSILNYDIINRFNGDVYYIYCDPNLPLTQLWPSISKKPWASNYKQSDIEITKPINVISQSYNINKHIETFKAKGITVSSIAQFDFQKFPMMFKQEHAEKTVDLAYGGTFRSGRREKKLIDFYCGYPEDLSVEVFGKIKATDFNPKKLGDLRLPSFTGAVDYSKMIHKMATARAHVAIGDTQYPGFQMISQRAYESVMANTITFIDVDFDKEKRVFGKDPYLSNLLYVTDRKQVYDRLKDLSDPVDQVAIHNLQHKAIGFNEEEFCDDFIHLLNGAYE